MGDSVKIYSSQDFPVYLPKLNLLYDDLFSGGKGFRSYLTGLVGKNIALESKGIELLQQTIEFIHNASLLHDDLVDRSQLRRGKPAAWHKYTPEYAVLAGDYLLARVMVNLSAYGNIDLVHYTAQMISDLLEGEWLQDSVVGDYFINLEQLDRIHILKTSSLFKWCLRAPFIAQKQNDKQLHHLLEEMGKILGQLFQRSDDLLDFNIRNHEGKAVLGDLKSGYLNSFGAYLTQGMSRAEIQAFVQSPDLPAIQRAMGGEEKFQEKLNGFDQINSAMIQLYHHYLSEVSKLISQPELIRELAKLTDVLYWRKKPS
ncbi:MAG: polyprenyl synthetase family protein [Bdellovibrionota bacterium]